MCKLSSVKPLQLQSAATLYTNIRNLYTALGVSNINIGAILLHTYIQFNIIYTIMLRHKENFKLKMHFTLKTMDRNVKNQGNKSKLSHCTSNSNTINYAAFHRLKTVSFFFHCSAFNFSRSEEFRCVNSQVDHLKSLLWSILNHHSASIRLYNPMHIHNAMHLLPLHCLIFTSCCRYYYYCCFWYYSHFNLCKTSVFFLSALLSLHAIHNPNGI